MNINIKNQFSMVPTLNLCPLGIERSSQPRPGFISVGRAKPSPAEHLVKYLALINGNNKLVPMRSELAVHKNISDLWRPC